MHPGWHRNMSLKLFYIRPSFLRGSKRKRASIVSTKWCQAGILCTETMWKPLSALGIACLRCLMCLCQGGLNLTGIWGGGSLFNNLCVCTCVCLSGGSRPDMARLVSLSVSSMSRGARNPSHRGSKCAHFSWVLSLRRTFLWEGARWWWGALVPARWYSAGAEQSQDETLLCSPLHISGFLCLCLDFQPLNWASAVKGLQPRGQGYCLFLWLSSRTTQTGRRTDINIAFVTLWMLLLLSWAISYSLLSDFSSFSNRYTLSLSWKGGKRLEKGWQNPFVLHGLMLTGCCCSLFSSFCLSGGAVAAVGVTWSSGNASQLLRQGWKFFLGKRRWELCVFSLLSREFIMKFIRRDLWLC